MQRRTFIATTAMTAISISAFGRIRFNGSYYEADTPTTTDILGPFYRPGAPERSNLRLPGTTGKPIVLKGTILKEDGKTPVPNALVEIWHCDEKEVYDNASDDYRYRGGQRTGKNGQYTFLSILPVPYKASADDESSWRPSHIHMRVSVPGQQDLITQIYFKGGKYVETDRWASAPQATNRLLEVSEAKNGESEIIFNVVLNKEYVPDPKAVAQIEGLYDMGQGMAEFYMEDDLLYAKHNGQLVDGLKYMGDNRFEGGIGYPKVHFEVQANGGMKVTIDNGGQPMTGTKVLKYRPHG
jgi:catechol 1,2-dioxygenase